jgi:2-dehydro-3-deoxygalactonokinase
MNNTALITLDWGTSNLRASLLDQHANELEHRSGPCGIMAVKDGLFREALVSLIGDWLEEYSCPLIASGMIGSRQGWKEAPYLDCPATLAQAAKNLTHVGIDLPKQTAAKRQLHIAPGLRCLATSGQFDVMRGEETQVWGANITPGSLCVLPGTHSKWAWVEADGSIGCFRTYMTGELYGLLTKHSILGRLMSFGAHSPSHFETGVRLGLDSPEQASHLIFSARTAGLMGSIPPEGLPDYLSGILTGIEIAAATVAFGNVLPNITLITLIGDDDLCARYEKAFDLIGVTATRAPANATTCGQWMIAKQAGLV